MTEIQFGRLVDLPARDAWRNEERDFTPWLAANISQLGEAIGIPLELTGMEVPIEVADDGKTIHAIEAEADPLTIIVGSIIAIDAAAGTVIIETEDDNDTLIRVPLKIDGNAMIGVDGKRSELVSVLSGSEVILRTTADRSSVRAMRATSPEVDDDAE